MSQEQFISFLRPFFKMLKLTALSTLLVLTLAAADNLRVNYSQLEPSNNHAHPVYNFNYAVADIDTYTNFKAEEARNEHGTTGSYSVALPDGRVQTVRYRVDPNSGFVADVTYTGEAQYPPEPATTTYNSHPGYYSAPVYRSAPVYPSAPVYRSTPVYHSAPVYRSTPVKQTGPALYKSTKKNA